jgi:hypothetical protein
MKNKYFLWIAAALLLIVGCTKNELVDEQPTQEAEGCKLVITAYVPSESTETRISLEPEIGTKNFIVKWEVGDVIHFFFEQGTTLKVGTNVTLTQQDISQNGQYANFTVNIPAEINTNNNFTLYALHGVPYIFDATNHKININVSPIGFSLLTALNSVPVSGEVAITPPVGQISINFNHLGVWQCLNFKNTSGSDFTITPTLTNTGGTTWYYTYSGGTTAPHYDLIGKQVADATVTPSSTGTVNIPTGSTVQLAQWVMPKAVNTPEIKLNAQTSGGTTYVSENSKPARTSALQEGKAYHLFAVWDGTSLFFTDHTFTPKDNPLGYVAEYNINPAGNGFVNDLTACNISGYFNYNNAVAQFGNITIGGQRYHLPSFEEWSSIAPSTKWVYYGTNNSYDNQSETVTVAGNIYTMTSDFRNHPSDTTTYALRYKGTHLVSAWKYEYTGKGTNNCHLKITSRSVYGQTIIVNQIADASFWGANTENDVVRYFPASGNSKDSGDVGIGGAFWSSTSGNIMGFRDTYAQSKTGLNNYGFSVRLFISDN